MKTLKHENELIVGLDVGTTKICVIVARLREDRRLDIIGIGKSPSYGLVRGVVVNPQKATESIKQAIDNAQKNSNTEITNVAVGIAGHHIRCMQTSTTIGINNADNTIHEEDIERILEQAQRMRLPADTKIITTLPTEFTIDDKEILYDSPVGMYGIKLSAKVNVVTGLVSAIDNLSNCIYECGIDIEDIILQPIASSLAVLEDTEKQAGVALLDIGGGTTDVAVFKKNVLKYTAGIGIAGNLVTSDIINGLGILEDEAERIKKEYGYALVDEIIYDDEITTRAIRGGQTPKKIKKSVLGKIIQSRMEEIFELAAMEIENSQIADELPAGIIITGGGSLIKGSKELAENILGKDVTLGSPRGLSGGFTREIESPIYSTGVGLVMYMNNSKVKKSVPSGKKMKLKEKENSDSVIGKIKKWFEEL